MYWQDDPLASNMGMLKEFARRRGAEALFSILPDRTVIADIVFRGTGQGIEVRFLPGELDDGMFVDEFYLADLAKVWENYMRQRRDQRTKAAKLAKQAIARAMRN